LKAQRAAPARQSTFTKLQTQGKAATIASYHVCHVLGKHNEPFGDSDSLKNAFLEAANGLFENFNNKT